jgi:hypothetical protein
MIQTKNARIDAGRRIAAEKAVLSQAGRFFNARKPETNRKRRKKYLPAKPRLLRVFGTGKPETNRKFSLRGDRTQRNKTKGAANVT